VPEKRIALVLLKFVSSRNENPLAEESKSCAFDVASPATAHGTEPRLAIVVANTGPIVWALPEVLRDVKGSPSTTALPVSDPLDVKDITHVI